MSLVVEAARHALMITAFVLVMMLLIEYVNVLTRGVWTRGLQRRGWQQYALAVLLGAAPGCLGAFIIVTLFEHGIVSSGALIATMIATSGDESFVMLALVPRTFAVLTGLLIGIAALAGVLVDWYLRRFGRQSAPSDDVYEVHGEVCHCYPRGEILAQWRHCTLARTTLVAVVALFIAALLTGDVGPAEWNWVRITLLATSALALFIVVTVPDHFLDEHLWEHVLKRHVPRIFAWTFGALLVTAVGEHYFDLSAFAQASPLMVLLFAALTGIIPESGPHLVFVTLYARGTIPFSVLLTSSVVQDGHGMLPLLAYSRRDFVVVKAVNLVVGLAAGLLLHSIGL